MRREVLLLRILCASCASSPITMQGSACLQHGKHDYTAQLPAEKRSISGLVVEYIVVIDVTRVRFPADASFKPLQLTLATCFAPTTSSPMAAKLCGKAAQQRPLLMPSIPPPTSRPCGFPTVVRSLLGLPAACTHAVRGVTIAHAARIMCQLSHHHA